MSGPLTSRPQSGVALGTHSIARIFLYSFQSEQKSDAPKDKDAPAAAPAPQVTWLYFSSYPPTFGAYPSSPLLQSHWSTLHVGNYFCRSCLAILFLVTFYFHLAFKSILATNYASISNAVAVTLQSFHLFYMLGLHFVGVNRCNRKLTFALATYQPRRLHSL